VAVTYDAVHRRPAPRAARRISPGIKRLALLYLWITIASGGVVYFEPAPYDALMIGAMLLLPIVGLVPGPAGLPSISCCSVASSPAAMWRPGGRACSASLSRM